MFVFVVVAVVVVVFVVVAVVVVVFVVVAVAVLLQWLSLHSCDDCSALLCSALHCSTPLNRTYVTFLLSGLRTLTLHPSHLTPSSPHPLHLTPQVC